jgi:hypothetical protein
MMEKVQLTGKVAFFIKEPQLRTDGRNAIESVLVRRKALERLGNAAITAATTCSASKFVSSAGLCVNDGAFVIVVVPSTWNDVNLRDLGHELTRIVYATLGVDETTEREALLVDEELDHLWRMEWVGRASTTTTTQ